MIEEYTTPEELQRMLSTLLVVIVGITLFALFACIVVPGLRGANKPPAGPSVAAAAGESGWLDPREYPPRKGYVLPVIDGRALVASSPGARARGAELYAVNCAPCHGDAGKGDGRAALGILPAPRDFTDPRGWKNGSGAAGVFKTLEQGIPGGAMAAYETLALEDRMALVHYVRSLGGAGFPPESPQALAALAARLSSGRERVPGRIPVSMAIRRLAQEDVPAPPLALPASGLTARAVTGPALAARVLAGSKLWRKDPAALARFASSGVPGNGFAAAVVSFSGSQWRRLQRALIRAENKSR